MLFRSLRMVDALVARRNLSESEFLEVRKHHDEPTILGLVFLIGMYITVGLMVAVARPEEDNLARTPIRPSRR